MCCSAKIVYLDGDVGRTDESVRLDGGNDMESFAVACIHNFLAGIPTVHQNANLLIIVCLKSVDHFNGQIVLALEGDLVGRFGSRDGNQRHTI
ncbi:hypothetical protein SAMN04487970_11061 [Paenibacillus tianmuensis]|uniref:Uncharacterized protein n=1 Tax=Paenibacillus tianmuensis TaxID=624147 RepID=A0A1G4U2U3_9BACL|nr:hypothetical protein SAMN04487970_11061 [Paenibacillus tianmuensis]